MTDTCPCGAPLDSKAGRAHGVCDRCRVEAHKPRRRRKPKPDFVDVPLPGLEDWPHAERQRIIGERLAQLDERKAI